MSYLTGQNHTFKTYSVVARVSQQGAKGRERSDQVEEGVGGGEIFENSRGNSWH